MIPEPSDDFVADVSLIRTIAVFKMTVAQDDWRVPCGQTSADVLEPSKLFVSMSSEASFSNEFSLHELFGDESELDEVEAKQEARRVGQKRKSAPRTTEADRWLWTLFRYETEEAKGVDEWYGTPWPDKAKQYTAILRGRGKIPDPIQVNFTCYKEEVCPSTGRRHLQGYSEFGTTLA